MIAGGPARFTAEPGSQITVTDPATGRTRTVTVAALAPSDYLIQSGLFYGAEGARNVRHERQIVSGKARVVGSGVRQRDRNVGMHPAGAGRHDDDAIGQKNRFRH